MNFKRFSSILICLVMLFVFAACESGNNPEGTKAPEKTNPAQPPNTTEAPQSTEPPKVVDTKKVLKVLAIGNSFSTDAMQYLYEIAKNAGTEQVVLGNLYYGGCSIDQHYEFLSNDSAEYTYYKNDSGEWKSSKNQKMSTALADEEWDFITIQQTSKTSGLVDTYGDKLDKVISYVKQKAPGATLVWHATWAYQQDSTHTSFPNYDNDQQKMYDMIIDCVEARILTNDNFKIVIPCTTSIQNARTSFIGDTLTRDGYHLDHYIGRYIAGLTWYAAITGQPVDAITFNPSTSEISEDMLNVAKEAVTNAMKKPLEITQSSITEGKRPGASDNTGDFKDADKELAASNGVNLSKYTLLEWDYLKNTYWNCTKNANTTTPASSNGTYNQNVCSKQKYSIEDIPVGSVFIVDEGWQFRLDIFPEEDQKYTGKRHAMITQNFFVLTEEFLNECNYMGWNIASNPKGDISDRFDEAPLHLRVYVLNAQ